MDRLHHVITIPCGSCGIFKNNDHISKYLYLGTMTTTTIIFINAIDLFTTSIYEETLEDGGQCLLCIQFLDSLSLIMVTTASFVITLIMAYGFGRGEHKQIVITCHRSYYF